MQRTSYKLPLLLALAVLLGLMAAPVYAIPGEFTLVSPPDESSFEVGSLPDPLLVTWNVANGATEYGWFLYSGTDTQTGTPIATGTDVLTPGDDSDPLLCDASTCTLTIADPNSVLTTAGAYTWDVVARDDTTDVRVAPFFNFTLTEPTATLGAFNLLTPPDGTDVTLGEIPDPLPITWEESTNATEYTWQVWAGTDTTGTPAATVPGTAADDTDAIICDSGVCTLSLTGANTLITATGTYTWNVIAGDGTDTLASTNFLSFDVVEPAAGLGAFNLLTPTDGTDVTLGEIPDPLPITWEESTNATNYTWQVWAGTDTSGTPAATVPGTAADDTDAIICASGVCTLSLTGANTLITATGTYTWNVIAGDGTDTLASTNFLSFDVVEPAAVGPAAFELLAPGTPIFPGPVLRNDLTDQTVNVTFTEAAGATEYAFTLFLISNNNTRLGAVVTEPGLTPGPGDDGLLCALNDENVATCTLEIPLGAAGLANGLYAWTVVATNANGDTEATNAPLFFEVQQNPVVLLDEGFEDYTGRQPEPTWDVRTPSRGDRIRCDNPNSPANNGSCAYQFRGSVPDRAALRFSLEEADLATYNLVAGDTLNFSVFVNPYSNTAEVPGVIKIRVAYNDGTERDDVLINLPVAVSPGSYGGYQELTAQIPLASADVRLIRVVIRERARYNVDDVSLTLNAPPNPAPPTLELVPLPLPGPADVNSFSN